MAGNNNKAYSFSDDLWEQIEPLLPPKSPELKRSCPCISKREAMGSILCILRTRGDLENIEAGSPLYEYLIEWRRTGVFDRMWQVGILTYDELEMLVLWVESHNL